MSTSNNSSGNKSTRKERKARQRAAKHAYRIRDSVVTSADTFARLEAVLHGERTAPGCSENGLADAASETSLGVMKPGNVTEQELDDILATLGVKAAETRDGKRQLRELRVKIAEHLYITRKEDEATRQREEGFWRYVSRKTHDSIMSSTNLRSWKHEKRLEDVEDKDSGVQDSGVQESGVEESGVKEIAKDSVSESPDAKVAEKAASGGEVEESPKTGTSATKGKKGKGANKGRS